MEILKKLASGKSLQLGSFKHVGKHGSLEDQASPVNGIYRHQMPHSITPNAFSVGFLVYRVARYNIYNIQCSDHLFKSLYSNCYIMILNKVECNRGRHTSQSSVVWSNITVLSFVRFCKG